MKEAKIDPSLAEVRRWREEAQKDRSHLDRDSVVEEIHRAAEHFIRAHDLKLKIEKRDPVKV